MSSPKPPFPLEGHCSVVYDNALYVYTPSNLMMLPLQQGGNWSTLDPGQSVTGAACVQGSVDGSPDHQGLYVVGGSSENSTYSGLQRYSFVDKKWETVALPTNQMQNRVNHSVSYLSSSTSILVYAGSQDSNQDASTSTFEITMTGGSYVIQSRSANGAPAAIRPILLPWDNQSTVYVGGMETNTEVFFYHAGSGWETSGMSLAAGISTDAGVAMQSNSDGSKFLEIFDMSASPNNVTYVALTQSGGAAAYPGEPVTFATSTGKSKRAWGNLPAYNGTFAPSTSRSGFSVAQSNDGLVVISGGSDSDPVAIFNQTENSWVDTSSLFGNSQVNGGLQEPLGSGSTTTSTAPTAASTSTSSATASASTTAAAPSSSGSSSTGLIVGATLGALAGISILLVLCLVILRRLHRKKQPTNKRRYGSDDKDRLSFQDQGIEPLTQAAVPMARSNAPSAVDSIYMVSGKFANDNPSATPMVNNNKRVFSRPLIPQNQNDMTTNISNQENGSQDTTTKRYLDPNQPRGDRSTNEGWSKYFQDTTTTDIGIGSPRNTMDSELSQESRSDYGSGMWPHVPEKAAITLGGLDEPRPLGQVSSGSPSTEHLPVSGRSYVHHGQSAKISSGDSASSVLSDEDDEHDRRDAFSSGIPASINDTLHWSHPRIRPPSSNYTESLYHGSARNVANTHDEPLPSDAQSQARGSSAIFHQDYFNPPNRNNINSDMSWLNIHADR